MPAKKTPTPAATKVAEPKIVVAKVAPPKINRAFIELQLKAEGVLDQYLGVLEKRFADPNLAGQQVSQTLVHYGQSVEALYAMGLIDKNREDLPEPEPEPEPEKEAEAETEVPLSTE